MRTIIFHHHLFKNAGTSLDALLKEQLPGQWVTREFPENPVKNRQLVNAWVAEARDARCFSSHTAFAIPDVPGTTVLPIIFIRHPLDRIASAYTFERQQGDGRFGSTLARNTTLAGYIETRMALPHDRQVENFHVQRFARLHGVQPGDELQQAMRAVDELPFVGVVEDFDASLERLETWLRAGGFPELELRPARHNVSKNRAATLEGRLQRLSREIGRELYAKLEAANADDLALYDHIRARLAASDEPEPEPAPAQAPDETAGPASLAPGILVLGMGRSGTSVTARFLQFLGCDGGPAEALMPAHPDVNPKGFFEYMPVVRANDALLRRFGGSWSDIPDLPDGWADDAALDDLRGHVRRRLRHDFPDGARWVIKDPRLSVTLPFWKPLLPRARFVICFRDPLAVAGSLAARDGLSVAHSLGLWRRHLAWSIVNTAGSPRMFVDYDDYFDATTDPLAALQAFVNPGSALPDDVRQAAAAWLDPGLRHHPPTEPDRRAGPGLRDDRVAHLHRLLVAAARGRDDDAALDRVARASLSP